MVTKIELPITLKVDHVKALEKLLDDIAFNINNIVLSLRQYRESINGENPKEKLKK
jgi:hypothetical protein